MKYTLETLPDSYFAEIFQENKTKFAFVKQETRTHFTQQHGLVNCRDFMSDVLYSEEINEYINIYSFQWDPETQKIDRDATKFMVRFQNEGNYTELKKNLPLIHTFEKKNNLKPTKILHIDPTTAIIIGSPMYLRKGWALSFYTWLIKAYTINSDFNELTGNEGKYYREANKKGKLNKLMSNFRKLLRVKGNTTGIKETEDIYVHHNYAGFVSVCTNASINKYSKALNKMKE